jgi:RNA polymerase sigma factor (sigma-70 family)
MNSQLLQKIDKSLDYLSDGVSRRTKLEKEDIKQELLLKCLEVQDQYDKRRGKEVTFFIKVIKNQANLLIRKYYNKKNEVLRALKITEIASYKNLDWCNTVIYSDIDFENRVITIQILNKVKDKLEGRSKLILEELMHNSKVKDISEKLGISHNNVSNIIRRKIRPLVDLEF